MNNAKQKGFTIVELLIVIVVIGILAAIVIVAYNGIAAKASNTQTLQAVGQYTKMLTAYAANNQGKLPINPSPSNANDYASCMAPYVSGAICGNTTDGSSVSACGNFGGLFAMSWLDTALKTVASNLPQLNSQKVSCGGKQWTGGWYYNDGSAAYINVYFKGASYVCPSISGLGNPASQTHQDDMTMCFYNFSA